MTVLREDIQLKQRVQKKILMAGLTLLPCAILSAIIYYIVLYSNALGTAQQEPTVNKSKSTPAENIVYFLTPPDTEQTPRDEIKIVTRKEWFAQPPVHPADPLKHPVPYVVILHTSTENCSTQAQCVFFVRHTQTFHIESNGWWDIGYSFLVGGDGNVYEGRGWDGIGAFVYGYNNVSIGIAFIGTFISELPPQKQISAGKALIAEGVRLGKISKNYKLFAHRQLSPTENPGYAFFENIKTWEHWAEKP